MFPMMKNTASGVITFHTPFSVSLLKSQECTTAMKEATDTTQSVFLPSAGPRSTRGGKMNEESSSRPKLSPTQDWLSHTSLRQLQAKMEVENQQARKIIKPLLDRKNSLVKELERFLSQSEETQLRRRELLHKHWTERVWVPLQKRVEEHVSSCGPAEAKRRQSLYSQFLDHCNTKGFVFLETYDPTEYNPFLLNIKKLHFKQHEIPEEQRIASFYEAGCKCTKRHIKKLPQSDRPLIESVTSQAKTPLQVPSNYPASAFQKTPAEEECGGKESSRLSTIPYHVGATATADGRCHHTSCWFSRCGSRQQSQTRSVVV